MFVGRRNGGSVVGRSLPACRVVLPGGRVKAVGTMVARHQCANTRPTPASIMTSRGCATTITPEEIEAEFAAFAEEISHADLPATPLLSPKIYDFDELEKVDKGVRSSENLGKPDPP